MGRREFRRGAIAVGKARQSSWFQFQPTTATFTASGGTIIFSLNAAALALRPFTIVRSHFLCMISSDQGAAIESQAGAWGIAVVSDEAVAVGVTAVPTPITEMGSDLWFVHQQMYSHHQEITDRAEPAQLYETDSKAMRKVGVGQDVVVVAELSAAGSGFKIILGGRMLIKNN